VQLQTAPSKHWHSGQASIWSRSTQNQADLLVYAIPGCFNPTGMCNFAGKAGVCSCLVLIACQVVLLVSPAPTAPCAASQQRNCSCLKVLITFMVLMEWVRLNHHGMSGALVDPNWHGNRVFEDYCLLWVLSVAPPRTHLSLCINMCTISDMFSTLAAILSKRMLPLTIKNYLYVPMYEVETEALSWWIVAVANLLQQFAFCWNWDGLSYPSSCFAGQHTGLADTTHVHLFFCIAPFIQAQIDSQIHVKYEEILLGVAQSTPRSWCIYIAIIWEVVLLLCDWNMLCPWRLLLQRSSGHLMKLQWQCSGNSVDFICCLQKLVMQMEHPGTVFFQQWCLAVILGLCVRRPLQCQPSLVSRLDALMHLWV